MSGKQRVVYGDVSSLTILDEESDIVDLVEKAVKKFHVQATNKKIELSLDIKDLDVVDEVLRVARAAGASERLWLCHPDVELLSTWRDRSPAVHLVHSTRMGALGDRPEPHAARLRASGIDAVNLHHSEWSGGMVALFHRFGRVTLGWDAQHERVIRSLLLAGIDGVFSDHVDRLVDVAAAFDEEDRPIEG